MSICDVSRTNHTIESGDTVFFLKRPAVDTPTAMTNCESMYGNHKRCFVWSSSASYLRIVLFSLQNVEICICVMSGWRAIDRMHHAKRVRQGKRGGDVETHFLMEFIFDPSFGHPLTHTSSQITRAESKCWRIVKTAERRSLGARRCPVHEGSQDPVPLGLHDHHMIGMMQVGPDRIPRVQRRHLPQHTTHHAMMTLTRSTLHTEAALALMCDAVMAL